MRLQVVEYPHGREPRHEVENLNDFLVDPFHQQLRFAEVDPSAEILRLRGQCFQSCASRPAVDHNIPVASLLQLDRTPHAETLFSIVKRRLCPTLNPWVA